MLHFLCFLVTVVNSNFGTEALISLTIGEDNIIQVNEIAGTPIWQTYPPEPSTHPGYEVTNVGTTGLLASIYWKDSWPLQPDDVFCEIRVNCSINSSTNVWYELADPVHIEPSKTVIIRPSAKATFYYTRLVVIANDPEDSNEAIVHVEYDDSTASPRMKRDTKNSNFSVCDNVKIVFKLGGSKLPPSVAASGVEALLDLFWPENNASVWDEVRDQVKNLVDQETFYTINALLTGRLMGFKRRLLQVAREVKEGQSDVSVHYMNLAQDFIGLEEEAIIRGHHNTKKLNEDLLPVYSNIILMKAAFYNLGLKCQQKIGLSKQNVENVRMYFTDMIRSPGLGADQHISQVFRNQSIANNEYARQMYVRNKLKEHGYVPIWNNILEHPEKKLVVDEIYYSESFGVFYVGQDVFLPSTEPLTSYWLSNRKYNGLQKLILYQSTDSCECCASNYCCPDTIVGMKQIFENGDTTEYGELTHMYRIIELGAYRIRAVVAGSNSTSHFRLSYLRISLLKSEKDEWKNAVNSEYTFGCPPRNSSESYFFAKPDYYIASIFARFDTLPRYRNVYPMLHMGVSFLPLKSQLQNNVDEKNWKEWTC